MKIQVYGDSLMKAIVVDDNYKYRPLEKRLIAQLQEDTGTEIINRARFGCTSQKGQTVLQRDLEKGLDCTHALLEFGGNDCDFNWPEVAAAPDGEHQPHTPLQQFLDTMTCMVKSLLSVGVKPVLMTLPPLNAQRYLDFIGRNGSDTGRILHWLGDVQMIYRYQEMYSGAIVRLAGKLNLPLIDVRSRFLERRDYGNLIARDGIHLTEAGYGLICDQCRALLHS